MKLDLRITPSMASRFLLAHGRTPTQEDVQSTSFFWDTVYAEPQPSDFARPVLVAPNGILGIDDFQITPDDYRRPPVYMGQTMLVDARQWLGLLSDFPENIVNFMLSPNSRHALSELKEALANGIRSPIDFIRDRAHDLLHDGHSRKMQGVVGLLAGYAATGRHVDESTALEFHFNARARLLTFGISAFDGSAFDSTDFLARSEYLAALGDHYGDKVVKNGLVLYLPPNTYLQTPDVLTVQDMPYHLGNTNVVGGKLRLTSNLGTSAMQKVHGERVSTNVLTNLIDELCDSAREEGFEPLAVYDMDGTEVDTPQFVWQLFHMWRSYAKENHPDLDRYLDKICTTEFYAWNMVEILEKLGVSDPAILAEAKSFHDHFFYNAQVRLSMLPLFGPALLLRKIQNLTDLRTLYLSLRSKEEDAIPVSKDTPEGSGSIAWHRNNGLWDENLSEFMPYDGERIENWENFDGSDKKLVMLAHHLEEHPQRKPVIFAENIASQAKAYAEKYPDALVLFVLGDEGKEIAKLPPNVIVVDPHLLFMSLRKTTVWATSSHPNFWDHLWQAIR